MARSKQQVPATEYAAALEEHLTPEGILEETIESVDSIRAAGAEGAVEREAGTAVEPGAEKAVAYERRRDGGLAHISPQAQLPRELG